MFCYSRIRPNPGVTRFTSEFCQIRLHAICGRAGYKSPRSIASPFLPSGLQSCDSQSLWRVCLPAIRGGMLHKYHAVFLQNQQNEATIDR